MSDQRLSIVALGSSFAAGPGIQPIISNAAMRSGRNYAHQLAERLNANLTDLSASGATLLNVLSEVQIGLDGTRLQPQVGQLPDAVDIVTLTAGGNDLSYSGGMISESAGMPLPETPAVSEEQLTKRFVDIIDRVKQVAPNATIYLVEYISVFGDSTKPGVDTPLTKSRIQHYRSIEAVLKAAYGAAASARPGVKLVPISEQSRGHEVGTPEPWVSGFSVDMLIGMMSNGVGPYHPNLAGHEAVAKALYDMIAPKSTL